MAILGDRGRRLDEFRQRRQGILLCMETAMDLSPSNDDKPAATDRPGSRAGARAEMTRHRSITSSVVPNSTRTNTQS